MIEIIRLCYISMAKVFHAMGIKYGISMGIDDKITRGYGELDENGFWEYPLYLPEADHKSKEGE
jgi:hypothetical protein